MPAPSAPLLLRRRWLADVDGENLGSRINVNRTNEGARHGAQRIAVACLLPVMLTDGLVEQQSRAYSGRRGRRHRQMLLAAVKRGE